MPSAPRRVVGVVALIAAVVGALPRNPLGWAVAAVLAGMALLCGAQAALLMLVRRQVAPAANKKHRRVPERQDRAHGPQRS